MSSFKKLEWKFLLLTLVALALPNSAWGDSNLSHPSMVAGFSTAISRSFSLGPKGASAGNIASAAHALRKSARISKEMVTTRERKAAAHAFSEPGNPTTLTSRIGSHDFMRELVDSLTPDVTEVLSARGIDPISMFERLLSGDVDTTDPTAVLRELGDMSELTGTELAEARDVFNANIKAAQSTELRAQLTPLEYYRLLDRGIAAPRAGADSNIFKLARRKYRQYRRQTFTVAALH